MLAEMVLDVDASALLVYRAAWLRDVKGRRNSREAALAKLHATDSAQSVIDKAVQIFGGLGVTRGVPVESLYREIRALRIYEGASEVQKVVIARAPSRGVSAHEDAAPPRLAAAQGLCQRHLRRAAGSIVTAGVIGWNEAGASSSRHDLAGQFRQILLNTLAILAEDGAGPEHIVRMTWYVVDIDEYRAGLAEIGAAYSELIGRNFPAMAVVGVDGAGRAAARDRDRDDGGGARMSDTLHPRPPAAARGAARIPLRPARAPLSRAPQRRRRADRQAGSRRARRAQRCRRAGPMAR